MDIQAMAGIIRITDKEFQELCTFVHVKYGIALHRKRQLVEARLSNMLKAKGISSFAQYMGLLHSDTSGEEIHAFLNKITTNYSYFAREAEHFDFLMEEALPALSMRAKKELHIWSAGCSSGQEPYNLAMVTDQFFGNRKAGWDTTILATDISTNVLSKAKLGIYPSEDVEKLSPAWQRRYFKKLENGTYQIVPEIRKEVIFRTFNLMDPIPLRQSFDIIFCRNVMIYFDAKTTNALIERFYQATAPGGYLFIGHSESIDKSSTKYTYLRPSIYRRPPLTGR